MEQYSKWSAEHTVWNTVLPSLRSVVLLIKDQSLSALPSCLLDAGSLALVIVEAACLGTAAVPLQLDRALAHVEELTVFCDSLHAIVPAEVAWRRVDLVARDRLDLRFEALSSFAEAVPDFYLRFHSLQVCCPLPFLDFYVAAVVPSTS